MKIGHSFFRGLLIAGVVLSGGCATTTSFDYAAYRQHLPRSILVLPPRNESNIVEAPYIYLSTITRPLAECGYYVFPVAVVDAFMKENGMPSAEEMHGVSLHKIRDIIGADAVLYVTIEDWGQKYLIVDSMTVVQARAELIDVATGETIWKGVAHLRQGSGGGGDPIAKLIAVAVVQVLATSLGDPTYSVAGQANYAMTVDPNNGFLLGPYRPPGQEKDHCPR
jgi:hypothetical protein